MKTTVVYHRADFDGIFCREIARKFLGVTPEYLGWDYGDPKLPWPAEGLVYVLDLSPECFEQLPDINEVGRRLIWIDHHKSAIEKWPDVFNGYRIDGVAACRLAWRWLSAWAGYVRETTTNPPDLFWFQQNYPWPTKEMFVERRVSEPLAVRLAGEYDIWDKRDPDAETFQFGLRSVQLSETDWQILVNGTDLGDTNTRQIVWAGESAQRYQTREDEGTITALGFVVEFGGLKFLALNSASRGSMQFAAKDVPETGHDALLKFTWTGKTWDVSLYHARHRTDLDLSTIAVKYGGGGHRGACGFRARELPFINGPWIPSFVGEVKNILGLMCMNTAPIGRRLNELGLYTVPRKVEEEQAAALHWMLTMYANHGTNWREEGEKILCGEPKNETVQTAG